MYKEANTHSDVIYQTSANMYNLSTEVIFMDYWLPMSDRNGFGVISGVTVHRSLCYASLNPNILRQKNVAARIPEMYTRKWKIPRILDKIMNIRSSFSSE